MPSFQSQISELRHGVEEYAKQFPTIGLEKETMKYKNWTVYTIYYCQSCSERVIFIHLFLKERKPNITLSMLCVKPQSSRRLMGKEIDCPIQILVLCCDFCIWYFCELALELHFSKSNWSVTKFSASNFLYDPKGKFMAQAHKCWKLMRIYIFGTTKIKHM